MLPGWRWITRRELVAHAPRPAARSPLERLRTDPGERGTLASDTQNIRAIDDGPCWNPMDLEEEIVQFRRSMPRVIEIRLFPRLHGRSHREDARGDILQELIVHPAFVRPSGDQHPHSRLLFWFLYSISH